MNFRSCAPAPPISLPLRIYLPLHPCNLQKENRMRKNKKRLPWKLPHVTRDILLFTLLCLQTFTATSRWSFSKPLAPTRSVQDPHGDSSGYPAVTLCHGGPAALALQGPALSCAPADHRWGRYRGGPAQSPGSGLGRELSCSAPPPPIYLAPMPRG